MINATRLNWSAKFSRFTIREEATFNVCRHCLLDLDGWEERW